LFKLKTICLPIAVSNREVREPGAWFGHVDRDRCDLPVTIAILVLVTAAALAAVSVGVAGWLASPPWRPD
jgi:hypothetical protein